MSFVTVVVVQRESERGERRISLRDSCDDVDDDEKVAHSFSGERRMAMEEEEEAKRGSPRHATLTFTWRRGAKLTSSSSKNSPARANLIEVNCTGIGYKIGPRLRELARKEPGGVIHET